MFLSGNRYITTWILVLCSFSLFAQDTLPPTANEIIQFREKAGNWTILTASDSLSDWQITEAVSVFVEKVQQQQVFLAAQVHDSEAMTASINESLELAKADTNSTKEMLKLMKGSLRQAEKQEKKRIKAFKQITTYLEFGQKTLAEEIATQRKNWPKVFKNWQSGEKTIQEFMEPDETQPSLPAIPTAPPPVVVTDSVSVDSTAKPDKKLVDLKGIFKPKTKEAEKKIIAKYDPEKDIMLHPPTPACKLAVLKKDPFTGDVYKETARQELFRFTNSVMKKVLPPERPHVRCDVAIAKDGNGTSLFFTFSIDDKNARRTFGGLAQNSILTLKFMNGDLVPLFNAENSEVQYNPETGTTVFRGIFPIQETVLRKIEKNELDQIRVSWTAGYEDYEVQNVNLLQLQAACLK